MNVFQQGLTAGLVISIVTFFVVVFLVRRGTRYVTTGTSIDATTFTSVDRNVKINAMSGGDAYSGFRPRIEVVGNRTIKIVVLVHTAKKNYQRRLSVLTRTWMSKIPDWARVEFYTTTYDGPVPYSFPTILVNTSEYPHRGNDQLIYSMQYVMNKYPYTNYIYKVDDDTFVNWRGLSYVMKKYNMMDYKKAQDTYSGDFYQYTGPGGSHTTTTTSSSTGRKTSIRSDPTGLLSLDNLYQRNIYLGFCGCLVRHDSCGKVRNIAVEGYGAALEKISDFNYVCGGSGILLSRDSIEALLDYDRTFGCTRAVEDITIGLCLKEARNQLCIHDSDSFLSLNSYQNGWLMQRSNDDLIRRNVAGAEMSYDNLVNDMEHFWKKTETDFNVSLHSKLTNISGEHNA